MSQPTGPACAECGTPRPADGSLACSCARRAADAHRATRMAEAEAAEDFDPVRIRPFVEIGDDATSPDVYATSAESETQPADQPAGDRQGREDATSPPVDPPDVPRSDDNTQNSPRRRRIALGTGMGAAAAVLLTGCLVGGFLWYDSPDRDGSLSGGVRAGLPDERSTAVDPSSPAPSASMTSAQPSPSATSSPDTTTTTTTDSLPRPAPPPARPRPAPPSRAAPHRPPRRGRPPPCSASATGDPR